MKQIRKTTLLGGLYRSIEILTVLLICVIYVVQIVTPVYAAQTGRAENFLRSLEWIPYHPNLITASVICAGAGNLLGKWFDQRNSRFWSHDGWLLYVTQGMLYGLAMLLFQQNCDKIALFAIADRLDDPNTRQKRSFLTAMIAFYLLCNMEFTARMLHAVSLQQYLNFYTARMRNVLQFVIEAFSAAESVLFVLYLVLFVTRQVQEKLEAQQRNQKLEQLNEQLLNYAEERAHSAQVQERNRLAREIHDTLGHVLTGITAGADACLQMLDDAPELVRGQLERIADTARDGMQEVRRSVNALRPDSLEKQSLSAVLEGMCAKIASGSGTVIHLEENLADTELLQDEEDAVYRTVQEGITNAIRHGHATQIEVQCRIQESRLTIRIQDNGRGCMDIVPGFGLLHMQERMSMLGGCLEYESADGFRIEAQFPLRRKSESGRMA